MAQPTRTNRIIVMAGLGLVIALVAGSASISRWSRHPGPAKAPTSLAPKLPGVDPEASRSREASERRRALASRLRARIEAGRLSLAEGGRGGLLADAEPVPIYRGDGVLAGIELRDVAPDGCYARLGLRDGDRVRSLNGIPFDTPGLADALISSLVQSDRLELAVERADGRPRQLFVPRDRVFEWIEAMESPEPAP